MSKNGIFLVVIALVLGAVYVYEFTGWFRREAIQIIAQIRPGRAAASSASPGQEPVYPVSFTFDGKYQFTAVKVVVAADMATNKYPVPVWHLTSDSNSVPVKYIVYGLPIKGMKPAVARTHPEPLQPDVDYVLLLETSKTKAQTNFHTAKVSQP